MRRHLGYLCILFVLFATTTVHAQVSVGDNGRLSGLVFGDYYWFAESHNPDLKNQNGFWFRRIYLTYEHQLTDAFSSRLRLEMNNEGDFTTESAMQATVKDAYLKWSGGSHNILAGISASPTFGLLGEIWGYRSLEKAPQDLFGLGSSRDFGLSFKGKIGREKRLGYHFFAGNGNHTKNELNKGKKLMLALNYWLTDHLVVEAYGDWNDRPDDTDWSTLQGFVGYKSETVNIGALYSSQRRENFNPSGDEVLDLVSLFTNVQLNEKLRGFLRADHLFSPHPEGSTNSYLPMSTEAEPTFLVGGVDISLKENIHLMPNIESIVYSEDEAGNHPDSDIVPRLTLFYKF